MDMDPIIEVNNLSKEYVLAHRLPYETLRDTFIETIKKPFQLLRSKDRSKREDFWALKDINFSVQRGDTIGLIGPNGSGKSTLLKILSQITSPTTGRVILRGRVASLLEVGTGFHGELTGRENIYLNGAILGMSRKEINKKFDEIVEFSGVEQFLDTPVKRYSSGMVVRLAFSVAAHLDPDILIVDEVLAVGDAKFQKKSLGKMKEVSEQSGRTVIFVSHNMAAIRLLCNKGVYLNKGKTSGIMPLDQAISSYLADVDVTPDGVLPLSKDNIILNHFSLQQNDRPSNDIDGDQPFSVHIIFTNTTRVDLLRIGFFIKSVLGDIILRSLFADWQEKENFEPGRHTLIAQVPSRSLTAGTYVLEPHISRFGIIDYGFGGLLRIKFHVSMPTDFNPEHPGEEASGFLLLKPKWSLE